MRNSGGRSRGAAAAVALVPEVAEARDHVRGSGGPTLEREGVPFRFVFRHFPLVEIHPHALTAAEASEAAGSQGRFWPMHDLLFRRQSALERADLERYAGEIGLDVERLREELEAHVHLDRVEGDRASAVASRATGTPTIFVDGLLYDGSSERADLRSALIGGEVDE